MTPNTLARAARRRHASWAFFFLMPSLAGCLLFVFIPFIEAISRSFWNAFQGGFVGFRYYQEILSNPSFLRACANTGRFILLCVPVLIVLGLLLALLLYGAVPGRGALRATFLLPMAIPAASVALLWQVLFHRNGLLNGLLNGLSLMPIDWMKTGWSLFCLVLTYVWKNLGYTMILLLAGLMGISPALYEAANVDGAGRARRFFAITLPCLKPTLFTVSVLSLLNSFKAYREAYLVAGSYPQGNIYLLQHTLNNWFTTLEIEKLSAAAVTTALVIVLLVALLNRAWAANAWEG